MRLQVIISFALLYVLFAIFYKAWAFTPPVVKVVAPASPSLVDNVITIVGAEDNQDGTSTLVVIACGSKIMITAQNSELTDLALGQELERLLIQAIDRACK